MRSLGIQYGYYNPSDWRSAGIVDMMVETYADVFSGAVKVLFTKEEDKKAEELESWKNGILTKYLKIVEKQLESQGTQKFLVGNTMTIADFAIVSLTFNILKND